MNVARSTAEDLPKGYVAFLLHAHLPYVRHPEQERFLEESWVHEAVAECYLPLLLILEDLSDRGVRFQVAWSLSPPLLSMLRDPLIQERTRRHLDRLVELAEKEVSRQRHRPGFRRVAEFYRERFILLREYYAGRCDCDLTSAFRRLANRGVFEALASAATHGFLPLLRHEPASVRAQVELGLETYRDVFDRDPQGFWLPECGFYPGLDALLVSLGVRYVCLEAHGVLHAVPQPRYGVHAPIVCPSGLAAFGRDPECSQQVWSAEEGFPGHPTYREFYRDIGYELPFDYVAPYVAGQGVRSQTGIKYYRVSERDKEHKESYDRAAALETARAHAKTFVEWREAQAEWLRSRMDRRPIVLAPYDAELFGHWWFEGPEWLGFVLEEMAARGRVSAVSPGGYLTEYPEAQEALPSASSWGERGFFEVWLSSENDWIQPRLARAAGRLAELAFRNRDARGFRRRLLDQAARELLLAQSSDWAFLIKTGTAREYAERRVREHLENFEALVAPAFLQRPARSGRDRVPAALRARLETLEERHRIFPRLDFEIFSDSAPRPPYAARRFPRHVAFVTAEAVPFVKVGGLGDVAGALPTALARSGILVSVILPAYRAVDRKLHGLRILARRLRGRLGSIDVAFDLLEARNPGGRESPPGVRWLLIDCPQYFDREGVYVDPATREEYPDTAERFGLFARAALESLRWLGDPVDVLHTHDHQTALIPVWKRLEYSSDPVLGLSATLYTLHNLGYQGVYPAEVLDRLGLPAELGAPGGPFEHFGGINWMRAGIHFADKLSTVSPTYAREICEDPIQGAGLQDLLRLRRDDLRGILNGIDVEEWNPAADPYLPEPYDRDHLDGKRAAKKELLRRSGMPIGDLRTPVVGMVTRLVDQKGLDLVAAALDDLLSMELRLVVLGTGLPKYETLLAAAAKRRPDKIAALLRFDNAMAHLIEGGADMFLMPSLYEPCGLNQMYSLRYGTVPVVRETGGLADTVDDADQNPEGVGFTFKPYTPEAMLDALRRALRAYADPDRWRKIQRAGMARNHSWDVSAGEYLLLYQDAWAERR